jgi:hypothetical protein
MKFIDFISGFFWLLISFFVCVESIKMEVGRFDNPGPGFFVFLAGLFLGVCSLILIILSLFQKVYKIKYLWAGVKWNKVLLVIFSLFLYAAMLPKMGYLITTFGLIFFLLIFFEKTKIWVQIVYAAIIVLASYFMFHVLLKLHLPIGKFGF